MYKKVRTDLKPNTLEFENIPFVNENGFREYDVRWKYPDEINLPGMHILGLAIANYLIEKKVQKIIIAHDYRSYSSSIKLALSSGLVAGGLKVFDIGLAISPMAYFAQNFLNIDGVAMVTASHNENGWTGIKIGYEPPLTLGPNEIVGLKERVLGNKIKRIDGGEYEFINDISNAYTKQLLTNKSYSRKIRAVVACGNGTAGWLAPDVLKKLGVDVIPLHCDLDYRFPNYNPNPEDMIMLNSLSECVIQNNADIGLAFDGDGDRCGVVDNKGNPIFADKIGVLIAREISKNHKNSKFIVDVKSTSLFLTDEILTKNKSSVEYWKTGHSYIKRRSYETSAIAGFEKSGHYFFNKPIGYGYDDGLVSAINILNLLESNKALSMFDLYQTLQITWGTPTMNAHCPDDKKYSLVNNAVKYFEGLKKNKTKIDGQYISKNITINGIRCTLSDGTWGLIRASSNKPELVIVIESPTSEKRMQAMFGIIKDWIEMQDEVGEFNQTI
jgi:phosphomannomutase / phosphoglucomutase